MKPTLYSIDHLVLTVEDVNATLRFYTKGLGMLAEPFIASDGTTRWALKFGDQKINLHARGKEFDPKSLRPTPGSADLCFLSEFPLDAWETWLDRQGIRIEEGPVPRTGAQGPIQSLYVRDPDGNLVEISNRDQG
jgi:catechol 2,3-dioxygenase-like lactoylglutathione lyase family enzyme